MRHCFCDNMEHMKILMINGEAETGGIIEQAMQVIACCLKENAISYDEIVVDHYHDQPCIACGKCYRKRRCQQPGINEILEHLDEYDGLVVGGKVQYGKLNRKTISFLQRLMRCGNDHIAYIPTLPLVTMRKKTESDAWQKFMRLLSYNQSFIVNDEDHFVLSGKLGDLQGEEKNMLIRLMELMVERMKQGRQPSDPFNPVEKLMDYVR